MNHLLSTELFRLFQSRAKSLPDEVIIITEDEEEITFQELERRCLFLSNRLTQLGCATGTRIGIAIPRSLNFTVSLLASIRLGATFVPINVSFPESQVQSILHHAQCKFLLTTSKIREELPYLDGLTSHILDIDSDFSQVPNFPSPRIEDEHTVQMAIYYTSGSSGSPKGVVHSYESAGAGLIEASKLIEPDQIYLHKTAMSFIYGGIALFAQLLVGKRIVFAKVGSESDYGYLCKLAEKYSANAISFTATSLLHFLDWISKYQQIKNLPFKTIYTAGEPVASALVNQIWTVFERPIDLVQIYGTTERLGLTTYLKFNRPFVDGSMLPIEKIDQMRNIHVLDENLKPVSIGAIGEAYLAGPAVALGYLDLPEVTEKKFVYVPHLANLGKLYRTGDLFKLNTNGYVEYSGRVDFQIKLRGIRIDPSEIEEVILKATSPSPQKVIVKLVTAPNGNSQIAAYIYPNSVDISKIRDVTRSKLSKNLVPDFFILLERLPTNSNGKMDRNLLPEPERRPLKRPGNAVRTSLQRIVANIWRKFLSIDDLTLDDDFFILGGDSIIATMVVSELKELGLTNSGIELLFECSSLGKYTDAILKDSPVTPILKLNQNKIDSSPVFCIHGALGVEVYMGLSRDLPCPSYGMQWISNSKELSLEGVAKEYVSWIKTIQPVGPINLIGFCFGSTAVLEMARQLKERGEIVGNLILIDTPPFYDEEKIPTLKIIDKIGYENLFEKFRNRNSNKKTLTPEEGLKCSRIFQPLDELLSSSSLYSQISESQVRSFFDLFVKATLLLEPYQGSDYDGDITLFVNKTTDPKSIEKLKKRCKGKLIIKCVEGSHNTMMNASSLKKDISDLLLPAN